MRDSSCDLKIWYSDQVDQIIFLQPTVVIGHDVLHVRMTIILNIQSVQISVSTVDVSFVAGIAVESPL